MDNKKNNQRITAIVPAYNEAERISRVLDTLTTYPKFKEIIVINDGSTDNTEAIVRKFDVHYIKNKVNRGKGASMDLGVKLAKGDIIFFCDADISGLTHEIIDKITTPVVNGKVEMFIGMRNRKIYFLRFILIFVPLLGGERALTKRLWQNLPDNYKDHFKIETALNFYAEYYYKGFDFKVFHGLKQKIKEKKYGLRNGIRQRISMFGDIIQSQFILQTINIPKDVKHKRLFFMQISANTLGFIFAFIMLSSVYVGPVRFLLNLFNEELIEDPNAPLVHFLLKIAANTNAYILLFVGLIIVILNMIFLVLKLRLFLKIKYPTTIHTKKNTP